MSSLILCTVFQQNVFMVVLKLYFIIYVHLIKTLGLFFIHSSLRSTAQFDPPYFPGGSDSKASVYNAGDLGSIPGSGRFPGEENGNPLQYYCLENPTYGGACETTAHGVAKSRTQLSDFTFHFHFLLYKCISRNDAKKNALP